MFTLTFRRGRAALGFSAVVFAVVLALLASAAPASADPALPHSVQPHPSPSYGTAQFRGVNWADPRDNYASDAVVPTGLSTSDDYQQVYAESMKVLQGFRQNLGANTVRLPINPASVGTTWWNSYRATIDAATDSGFKVIVSYWESDSAKDGKIDDTAAWNTMWNTVARTYAGDSRVYFEPMNEPFGYTLQQWVGITSTWLSDHRYIPRDRVVISGTGYNDDVTGVGAAPQLAGTLLSLHFYGFWASSTTESDWTANLAPRVGKYSNRTIIDEAGAPMTIGLNYGAHNGNVYTSYFAALTDFARSHHMGIVYWPGLRAGDSYSIESLQPDGTLANNSASGVAQLQWGWGIGDREPVNDQPAAPPGKQIVGAASGRCVDVPGFSTTPGTALDLWDCNGGGNQSWNADAKGELTIYGSMCMQLGTDGTIASAGASVIIANCTGATVQQWKINTDGTITSGADSSLCLDAAGAGTGNGTAVDVWYCNGGSNQSWTLS
ncbi:ricin-type beta-trefoil lectin domain protein [Humibacter ginsengiterrae]